MVMNKSKKIGTKMNCIETLMEIYNVSRKINCREYIIRQLKKDGLVENINHRLQITMKGELFILDNINFI